MADKKIVIGGIVIDGLNIKKDLFYYKIPLFLLKDAKIGSRVEVPFGEKNELHYGFLFSVESSELPSFKEVKEIHDIVSKPLFNTVVRDLILFTSEKYFIPIHILLNKVLKTTIGEIYRKYVQCILPEELKANLDGFSEKKRKISEFILLRMFVPVSIVKKRFGLSADKYLKELEDAGFVKRQNVIEQLSKKYYSLNVDKRSLGELLNEIPDKKIKNAAIQIVGRIINAAKPVREIALKKEIKNGKRAIELLSEKKIIKATFPSVKENIKEKRTNQYILIYGMSLKERTARVIDILKKDFNNQQRTLIIFPEFSLINRVKSLYKKAFGKSIFVWDGTSKRNLVESIYFKDSKIILSTSFALFLEIPNLKYIILEGASSRYFRNNKFVPFDAEVIAIRRAEKERVDLIFSTSVPDENIYFLMEEGKINKIFSKDTTHAVKFIDMRKEFKKHNYKMLSLFLQKQIGKILQKDGNVAILLNRKSYSTFVMCRECGYVLRCPNCNVPLYYDKEKNILTCPVCGYKEKPPDICPRCGSTSIRYFSGGLQKLEEQLREMFKGTSVVKLISETGSKKIVNSSSFSKTIFIGTEFILSHLTLENISSFAFISIDIFLNHYAFNASFNTFRILGNAITEMGDKEVVVQTYVPEHFALSSSINLDFKHFFKEEFSLRKTLKYPPFGNLIIFTFIGKDKETVLGYSDKFGKKIQEDCNNCKNFTVLGPSPAPLEKKGMYYHYEVSIKTQVIYPFIRNIYMRFISGTSKVKISVSSFVATKECLSED